MMLFQKHKINLPSCEGAKIKKMDSPVKTGKAGKVIGSVLILAAGVFIGFAGYDAWKAYRAKKAGA